MAYPDPKIVTVAAPTNPVNTPRPAPSRSARSTAPTRHYVVILGGGQHPDAPGAVDGGNTQQGDQTTPDVAGAADVPEAGDTPDAPGTVNGGNTQQGDQSTPDAPGAVETADAPGA